MIPAANRESREGADDVGEDIEGVEYAFIWEEALEHFRANAK